MVLLAVACGLNDLATEIAPFSGEEIEEPAVSIDINNLMSDGDMSGGSWVMAARAQTFLN